MIKVEALKEFTLGEFDKLKNIVRKDKNKKEKGRIYTGDIFNCDKKMAKYLLGANDKKQCVVKIIEINN